MHYNLELLFTLTIPLLKFTDLEKISDKELSKPGLMHVHLQHVHIHVIVHVCECVCIVAELVYLKFCSQPKMMCMKS